MAEDKTVSSFWRFQIGVLGLICQGRAVSGQRSVVSGQRSVVSGQRSVVSGQWPVVGRFGAALID
ncbi:MAG: hypothetical protein C5B50_03045 [Verrucomicrobia bacterium]|nr:MAG: hypothetical protein C5B50_03045 [Verrucomicrobiota bacterium]